jgi:hypothetical protein
MHICSCQRQFEIIKKGVVCMQDKKHGGSEQGEESTAGGVSAVRKGIVLAFLLMTCAVALPNTVTNDVVVATSDAELRISDRGLGLGLEVVGGGAAEVPRR